MDTEQTNLPNFPALNLFSFANPSIWAQTIADELLKRVQSASPDGAPVRMALPGGSSPKLITSILTQRKWPGRQVEIFPSDERAVAPADTRRNDHDLILLSRSHPQVRVQSLLKTPADPETMMANLEEILVSSGQPFHLVVLGMGLDGHIASIFPAEETISQGESRTGYSLWTQRRGDDFFRLSLGWTKLLQAEEIWLIMLGQDKMKALQTWLSANDQSRPVVRLLQERRVTVFWSP